MLMLLIINLMLELEWYIYSCDVGGGQLVVVFFDIESDFMVIGNLQMLLMCIGKLNGFVQISLLIVIGFDRELWCFVGNLCLQVCDVLMCLLFMEINFIGEVFVFSVLFVVGEENK